MSLKKILHEMSDLQLIAVALLILATVVIVLGSLIQRASPPKAPLSGKEAKSSQIATSQLSQTVNPESPQGTATTVPPPSAYKSINRCFGDNPVCLGLKYGWVKVARPGARCSFLGTVGYCEEMFLGVPNFEIGYSFSRGPDRMDAVCFVFWRVHTWGEFAARVEALERDYGPPKDRWQTPWWMATWEDTHTRLDWGYTPDSSPPKAVACYSDLDAKR